MDGLLIFFALPIATIILSAVLEKILNCPVSVAGVTFAIYLVVAFTAFDAMFLIATIAYTFLSLVTAFISRFLINLINDQDNNNMCLTVTSDNINTTSNGNNSRNNCGCNCRRRF